MPFFLNMHGSGDTGRAAFIYPLGCHRGRGLQRKGHKSQVNLRQAATPHMQTRGRGMQVHARSRDHPARTPTGVSSFLCAKLSYLESLQQKQKFKNSSGCI